MGGPGGTPPAVPANAGGGGGGGGGAINLGAKKPDSVINNGHLTALGGTGPGPTFAASGRIHIFGTYQENGTVEGVFEQSTGMSSSEWLIVGGGGGGGAGGDGALPDGPVQTGESTWGKLKSIYR